MGRQVGPAGGDVASRVVAAVLGVLITAAVIAAAVAFFAVAATLVAVVVVVGISLAVWRRLRGPRVPQGPPPRRPAPPPGGTGDVIDAEATVIDDPPR